MSRCAQNTSVSSEKSRAEIERILRRYGADGFMYGWEARPGYPALRRMCCATRLRSGWRNRAFPCRKLPLCLAILIAGPRKGSMQNIRRNTFQRPQRPSKSASSGTHAPPNPCVTESRTLVKLLIFNGGRYWT